MKFTFLFCNLFLFSGCATILSGTSQTLTIETNPIEARCEFLREGRIIGVVDNTPGAVTVKKTKHDIGLKCEKPGYSQGTDNLHSGIDGAVFGNIIIGGLVGWAIDSIVGADNKYPPITTLALLPEGYKPPSSKLSGEPKADAMENKEGDLLIERLSQIEKLQKKGLITKEEYQAKRKEIISEL